MTLRFDPDQLPPELEAHLPTLDDFIKGLPEEFKKVGPEWAVLDENGEPQVVGGLLQWASWFEHNQHQKVLGREEIMRSRPKMVPELYVVSTVFLGLNHQYWPGRPALWWETMVFAPPVLQYWKMIDKWRTTSEDLWMRRCTTRTQALNQHKRGISFLKAYIKNLDNFNQPYEPGRRDDPSPEPDRQVSGEIASEDQANDRGAGETDPDSPQPGRPDPSPGERDPAPGAQDGGGTERGKTQ